jgi:hypothetical protein
VANGSSRPAAAAAERLSGRNVTFSAEWRTGRPGRLSGIMGIVFRVIVLGGWEFAACHGGCGASFGKKCHVFRGAANRLAGRVSGIMGIVFRVMAASRRQVAHLDGSGRTFGNKCHVVFARKTARRGYFRELWESPSESSPRDCARARPAAPRPDSGRSESATHPETPGAERERTDDPEGCRRTS